MTNSYCIDLRYQAAKAQESKKRDDEGDTTGDDDDGEDSDQPLLAIEAPPEKQPTFITKPKARAGAEADPDTVKVK